MSESGEVTSSLSVSNESSSSMAPPSGKSIDQKFQVLLSCVGKLPDQVSLLTFDWTRLSANQNQDKLLRKSLTRP